MTHTGQKLQIGEASDYLGVTPQTLRAWEKQGKITPLRTITNYRVYTKDQLDALLEGPKP